MTRYYYIHIDQAGIETVAFWTTLTDEQYDELVEEFDNIEDAVRAESDGSLYDGTLLVVDESELIAIRGLIDIALKS
jgi:hypothetical protein